MPSLVKPLTLAALFAVAATSVFAQAAPNPFDNVPKARTDYVAEKGDKPETSLADRMRALQKAAATAR